MINYHSIWRGYIIWYKLEYNLILAAISAFIRVYLRFKTRSNPQGWLPLCRPDGLRWQGIAREAGRRESARRNGGWNSLFVRHGFTRIYIYWKFAAFCFNRKGREDRKDILSLTLRPLRCNISYKLYFNSHGGHQQHQPPPEAVARMQSTRAQGVGSSGRGGRVCKGSAAADITAGEMICSVTDSRWGSQTATAFIYFDRINRIDRI